MKVLITGASGYVGSQTCKFLKKNSFYIYAVDRNQIKHKYFDQKIITDISDLKLIKILEEVDCVIHLAGSNLVAPSIKYPAKYYKDNVSSTILFLNACLTSGIQRFVFASSATVYGKSNKEIFSEEDLCKPSNPYGWSKYMIEILLKDYAEAYNFQSVSLRFFNVAGADIENELGQDKFSTHIISRLIEKSFSGEEFVLNGNNAMTESSGQFTDSKFNQNIVNLYPEYDRDNVNANPQEAVSFAKRFPIGDVVTNDLKKSITRETSNQFLKSFDVTNTVNAATNNNVAA